MTCCDKQLHSKQSKSNNPALPIDASACTLNEQRLAAFIDTVWQQGAQHHRSLPWRYIDDSYAVLVSEVMLQQTQVTRVLDYWPRFMRTFPTLDALASAENSAVLEMWQGLGYNRRALLLAQCAQYCAQHYDGKLPCSYEELIALPGIGPATAAGIRAFAYNQPGIYLETNVRTVFLYELFPNQYDVSDAQLRPLIEQTCSTDNPREWYYALLDYGAYLKKSLPNPSRRSKHHTRQSTFEGSRRQKRAELVRVMLAAPAQALSFYQLQAALNEFEAQHGRPEVDEALVQSLLDDLVKEGFFTYSSNTQTYTCT